MSVVGYEAPSIRYCRKCVPEGLREFGYTLTEADVSGDHCETCGEELTACVHEWGGWHAAFGGGEIRFCDKADCCETERRP